MSNLSDNELIPIATLGKSVGLHGEMRFFIKSDFPEQFKKNATFYIDKNHKVTIESINHERGLLKLRGCNTPEEAKKFTNKDLRATKEQTKELCTLGEGEHFWFDIIGSQVYEEEQLLGEVTTIERLPLCDYLVVDTEPTLQQKGLAKSFLIPYQPSYILSVDEKIIRVCGGIDILEAS